MCEEIHKGVGNALCSTINALCNNKMKITTHKIKFIQKNRRMRLHDKGCVKLTWIKENIYAKQ